MKAKIIKAKSIYRILPNQPRKAKDDWHLQYAINHFRSKFPELSAANCRYDKYMVLLLLYIFTLCLLFGGPVIMKLINSIFIITYLIKFYFLVVNSSKEESDFTQIKDFPVYSIIVPLYKEKEKVSSIISALKNLNYPEEKKDVHIALEKDDAETIHEFKQYGLPSYFNLHVIPKAQPKTKPKAMNYCLPFVKGKYVAIYDAEDVPDSDQLLKVLYKFQVAGNDLACVQCRLNYYNANYNALSKYFSYEYATLFNATLPKVAELSMPVPLGGTSNHFKTEILRQVGGWDPYNVTEDAELGLRFNYFGYRTDIVESYTMEESPIHLKNWLLQRVRWFKGHVLTYFIKTSSKEKYPLSWGDYFVLNYFIGLPMICYLSFPAWLINFIINYDSIDKIPLFLNLIIIIIYNTTSALMAQNNFKRIRCVYFIVEMFYAITYSLYFLLHITAAYGAIYEMFSKPFRWNKTQHGFCNYNENAEGKDV